MHNFEERLSRLETLSERLKEGNIPLEEAVTIFEEGMKLARGLERELSTIERKIEILVNNPDNDKKDDKKETGSSRKADTRDNEPTLELFPELADEEEKTNPHFTQNKATHPAH